MAEYVGRTGPGMIKFVNMRRHAFITLCNFGANRCDMNGNLVGQ